MKKKVLNARQIEFPFRQRRQYGCQLIFESIGNVTWISTTQLYIRANPESIHLRDTSNFIIMTIAFLFKKKNRNFSDNSPNFYQIYKDYSAVLSEISDIVYLEISTVNPVLSGHSKIDKTKVLMANGSLMKVESIAECSPWSILQYF